MLPCPARARKVREFHLLRLRGFGRLSTDFLYFPLKRTCTLRPRFLTLSQRPAKRIFHVVFRIMYIHRRPMRITYRLPRVLTGLYVLPKRSLRRFRRRTFLRPKRRYQRRPRLRTRSHRLLINTFQPSLRRRRVI